VLKEILAVAPTCSEAAELFDRLQTLKDREAQGSFRILRDWFPSGMRRGRS
jgi:hypothetical protein